MAKRHVLRAGDWESIFGRLQELVMANSGEDDFEEIFKLLIAKLFSELHSGKGSEFSSHSDPLITIEVINTILAQAAETWKGVFQSGPYTRLTPEHLNVCVQVLQDHSISETNLEVMDGAFEFLVNKTAKGAKGQYFTPRHVVEACVRIINPSPSELIADPACGSGGFLVHTLNYVREHNSKISAAEYCSDKIWGFDFDRRAIQVAKALMLIAGDGSTNLYQLNSLLLPDSNFELFPDMNVYKEEIPKITIEDIMRTRFKKNNGIDIVLTNPPFAGEIQEGHLTDNYELCKKGRRVERDVLFLERCVKLLRPGGRIGIVLPTNKFGAPAWTYVREWLSKKVRIVAVMGLARNTFLPHTHQKAGILFGIKREQELKKIPNEKILFLINEEAGKDSKGQFIDKPNTKPWEPAWTRADHDFGILVERFKDFVGENKINWGVL